MTKLKKKLNVIVTVFMVLCICLCLYVCLQVIVKKDASVFGFRIYNILTGSMEPTIPTGTNILVHSVKPENLQVGDIITFISQDAAIYGSANTHRIVAVETDADGRLCFRTRGDANSAEDLLPVYPENIKGKVIFHMTPSAVNFFGFLHTKVGFATVILLPLMLIVGLVTRDFKRSMREYIQETARVGAAGSVPQTPPAAEETEAAAVPEKETEAANAPEGAPEEASGSETEGSDPADPQ